MKTLTQYRVCFLAHSTVNGKVMLKEFSTQWFDSIELALSSKWMGEIGAHVVSRIYQA